MEQNGRNSCRGNSRHINICYFFVKGRVDKGERKIVYCPTAHMLADYFTKSLQGSLFNKFRSVIMGYNHISFLDHDNEIIKERVDISNEKAMISNNNNDKQNVKIALKVPRNDDNIINVKEKIHTPGGDDTPSKNDDEQTHKDDKQRSLSLEETT